MPRKLTEAQIDTMADDDRLSGVARRLAADAGIDWSILDGDQQDAWHERAIVGLREGKIPMKKESP